MKITLTIAIILNAAVLSVIAYQQREHYAKQAQSQTEGTEYKSILDKIKGPLEDIEQLQKADEALKEKILGLTVKIDTAGIPALEKKVDEIAQGAVSLKKTLSNLSAKGLPTRKEDASKTAAPLPKTSLTLPPNKFNAKTSNQEAWGKRRENRTQLVAFAKKYEAQVKDISTLTNEMKFATDAKKRSLFPRFQNIKARWKAFVESPSNLALINKCGIEAGGFCFLYLGTSTIKDGFIEKPHRNFAVAYNGKRIPQVVRFRLAANDAFGTRAFTGYSEFTWKTDHHAWVDAGHTNWTVLNQDLNLFSDTGGPAGKIENAYISELSIEIVYSD